MKIICFLFDPNVGGPTVRARAVYEVMSRNGYQVRIAFPRGEGSALQYILEKGIDADRLDIAKPVLPRKVLPFLYFLITAPISLYKLCKYLSVQKPDVIHVNGAFDILPAVAGRLSRVPIVWHLNDTLFGSRLSRFLGKFVQMMAAKTVVAADRVAEHYNVLPDNCSVIHAPVDISRFRGRTEPRLSTGATCLIMVGNWNWIKGQDKFVEVVQHLLDMDIDIKATIVGKYIKGQEGYWQPILDKISRHDLDDKFCLPGFSNNIPDLFQQNDIFLLPSHSEACPISLLEAMAMGVPSVVFDVGGAEELIGAGNESAGIVVKPGDTKAMADAVRDLINNPNRYKLMSLCGQERARKLYSTEVCIERHKQVYAEATQNL